jgi:glucokinase
MGKKKLFSKPMIGIDLGATKIFAAVADENGKIIATAKKKSAGEQGREAVLDRVADTALKALVDSGVSIKKIGAVGIGVPSPVDIKTGVAYLSPNLGWKNVPVKKDLEARLGLPVFVDNDVNVGTLGEHVLGAGRGAGCMAGIFVGTGIGGGIIIDGKVIHGRNMTGGELGHMIIVPDGPLCGCGNRGCLEALASRIAITRDVLAAIDKGMPTMLTDMLEKNTDRIKSSVFKKAYEAGDELTVTYLNRSAWFLGIAVANIVNAIGPDIVVIGGGFFEALGAQLLPIVRVSASHHYFGPAGKDMKVVLAELGDSAAALGAAVFASRGGI